MNSELWGVGAVLGFFAAVLGGWITNVIWTFQQTEVVPAALGILGVVVAPLGAIHGVWLWF